MKKIYTALSAGLIGLSFLVGGCTAKHDEPTTNKIVTATSNTVKELDKSLTRIENRLAEYTISIGDSYTSVYKHLEEGNVYEAKKLLRGYIAQSKEKLKNFRDVDALIPDVREALEKQIRISEELLSKGLDPDKK